MTATITWNINQLERTVEDGGVTVAHWTVSAVDGDYSASAYGSAGFTPDPEAPGFVPFEDLTEEGVLEWVWGSVDKDATEESLLKQIDAQKNPVVVSGMPW